MGLTTSVFVPGFRAGAGSALRNDRYLVSTALAYKLTREVWLKSELRREWQISNVPGNDYQAYVALIGVRLQR